MYIRAYKTGWILCIWGYKTGWISYVRVYETDRIPYIRVQETLSFRPPGSYFQGKSPRLKSSTKSVTLLVYCTWKTRTMCTSIMLSNKAAIRVIRTFWSDIESDRFEAQVLDCVSVVLNYVPSLAQDFNADYIEFCKKEKSYRMPARTAYGRQFLSACIALGLVDLRKPFLGGICRGQFGWPLQQLFSVEVSLLSESKAESLQNRCFHLYTTDAFTQEQLVWLLSGGSIRHTFGITDVDLWEFGEFFELIED